MPELQSESDERMNILVEAPSDPTGDGNPSFGYTAIDSTDQPGSWVEGTWETTYNTSTGTIWALTPRMPGSSSDLVVAEGEWQLWCKYTLGAEVPVLKAGAFTVE